MLLKIWSKFYSSDLIPEKLINYYSNSESQAINRTSGLYQ